MTREEIARLIEKHEYALIRPGYSATLDRNISAAEIEASLPERRQWLVDQASAVDNEIARMKHYVSQCELYASSLRTALASLPETVKPVAAPAVEAPTVPPTIMERIKTALHLIPPVPPPAPVAPQSEATLAPPVREVARFRVQERLVLRKFNGDDVTGTPTETIEIKG